MILRRIHKLITPAVLLRRNFSASSYASEMYQAWQQDPKSVSDQWDKYFQKHGLDINKAVDGAKQATQVTYTAEQMKEKELVLEAFKLIRYYELRGHELANIDPLCSFGLTQPCRITASSARSIGTRWGSLTPKTLHFQAPSMWRSVSRSTLRSLDGWRVSSSKGKSGPSGSCKRC
jgi:hypothetical protein